MQKTQASAKKILLKKLFALVIGTYFELASKIQQKKFFDGLLYCLVRSASWIFVNNPRNIGLFSYKFYWGPHKEAFRIVYYNPRCTYYQLVPKQYTFNATKGSPQFLVISKEHHSIRRRLWLFLWSKLFFVSCPHFFHNVWIQG